MSSARQIPSERWRRDLADAYYAVVMTKRWPAKFDIWVAKFDAKCRGYFLTVIREYMNPRLHSVTDAEDLLQEFYLAIFCPKHACPISDPLGQWTLLRRVAVRTALMANRHYLQTAKRDLRREVHELATRVA